ncbi:MAG: LysR family transcriptional regulator [Burkholderiales bacterium]|nr:LysR family transcriptional regulator [Burkholderiales bacterium]MDE1925826.1 LysR family transcriptional regulator [Burkholderiales bacterium]
MRNSDVATLNTTEMFCRAADKLSFTAAARALGTTPSAISKAVRRLENRLGVDLFHRTTRAIRLTEAGRAYYETCRQALAQIEQREQELRQGQADPSGLLRVSLPFSYAIKCVVPLIPKYLELHDGKIRLFVNLSNAVADFAADDFDLSIRIGHIAESRLIARPLHEARYRVVGSPAYLNEHGTPRHPDDLRAHRCVDLVLPDTGRPIAWEFVAEGKSSEVPSSSQLEFDHPIAAMTATLNGAGLSRLLDFTVDDEIRAGRLVEVLADYCPPGQPVSAVYPSRPHQPPILRGFLDFLIRELGQD